MYTSFIGLSIEIEQEERIIGELAGMDNVAEIFTMMGPFELFARVNANSIKELEATMAAIRALPGVQRTYNFLAVQQKKG